MSQFCKHIDNDTGITMKFSWKRWAKGSSLTSSLRLRFFKALGVIIGNSSKVISTT